MSPPDRAPDSWSARLAERLASFGYALRPVRRAFPVRGPLIGSGSVRAQVRGVGGHWHEVWIDLPVFTPQQWRRAEESLAPDLAEGRLPAGPAALDAAFARTGLSLLPATARDLTLECSCPDRSVPCAHLTAVLLTLADEFDADPFTLLTLRGRDRDRLLTHSPAAPPPAPPPSAEVPLPACLDTFWHSPSSSPPQPPALPPDNALHRLDPPPLTIRDRNLAALLAPAYKALNTW